MSTDQLMNIAQAAKVTGKSLMTIRAYLEAKPSKLPNAFQTPRGKAKTWNIPFTDLVAAGLLDKAKDIQAEVSQKIETLVGERAQAEIDLKVLAATLEAENKFLKEALAKAEVALERAERRVDQLFIIRELETAQKQKERRSFFGRKPKREFETMPSEHLSE
jgi:DNA-binding transcriptional MerR regulator